MPEEKTIHDLPIAEQVTSSDVFETEIPSQLMQSGFASRKVSLSELEEHILGDEQYSTGLPNFPAGSRTIFGALEYARQSGGGGGASVVQKTMAEYTALPTSEKMNGSIYKITDKALIYCLDEEYHAVLEITSADYALLTSDEKNNGTLYVITDEETTGSDIPVSDTDPNTTIESAINACWGKTAADIPYSAGVSVADKLAVISNTLVANTVTYYKVGNVVQLSLVGYSVPANTGTYATRHIIGYLPAGYRPLVNAYCPYVSSTINTLMVQYTDGEISIRNTSGNAQDAYASIMFITNG